MVQCGRSLLNNSASCKTRVITRIRTRTKLMMCHNIVRSYSFIGANAENQKCWQRRLRSTPLILNGMYDRYKFKKNKSHRNTIIVWTTTRTRLSHDVCCNCSVSVRSTVRRSTVLSTTIQRGNVRQPPNEGSAVSRWRYRSETAVRRRHLRWARPRWT